MKNKDLTKRLSSIESEIKAIEDAVDKINGLRKPFKANKPDEWLAITEFQARLNACEIAIYHVRKEHEHLQQAFEGEIINGSETKQEIIDGPETKQEIIDGPANDSG